VTLGVSTWSSREVFQWIHSTFQDGRSEIEEALWDIDGRRLISLTNEELIRKGLQKYPHRKQVLAAVDLLQQGILIPSNPIIHI